MFLFCNPRRECHLDAAGLSTPCDLQLLDWDAAEFAYAPEHLLDDAVKLIVTENGRGQITDITEEHHMK